MPRIYTRLGEKRRGEAITALFTADEKQRVVTAAQAANMPASVFIHHMVMKRLETAA